ncbi:MAG: LysM peptidoglycan-binding domain-containing protein [Gaiella sp.]
MFARMLVLVVVAVGLWALFARDTQATGQVERYTVRGGDTLWSIAEARSGGDIRQAIWEIRERNHLAGATIHPGQVLVIP